MKTTKLLVTALAAAAFSISSAYAAEDKPGMEKCKVVDTAGKNIVKENMADGTAKEADGAGKNKAGDNTAWIWVPIGECVKMNKGDFSGVSAEVTDKVEMTNAGK